MRVLFNFFMVSAFWLSTPCVDAAEKTELDGRWVQRCLAEGSGSVRKTVVFKENTIESRASHASDGDCQKPSFDFAMRASFAIRGDVRGAPGAKEIDFVVDQTTMTPWDADLADYLNESKACGLQNWAVGKAQVITGRKCGKNQLTAKGEKTYGAFKRDGDVLYSSFEICSDSEEARPRDFSSERYQRRP